jgi:nucleotide-binding universal stress UspA family protein
MTSSTSPSIPAPHRTARDELGRLVAVSWGTAPEDDAAGKGRWLVAVDGSEGSLRAAAMAARLIASDARAEVDLVHVHPWLVKEAAEAELARRGWHAAAAARALMDEAHITWRLHVRMGDAAEQIVALAGELGSRGIAIGSHGLTATESLFLGSVAYKVVHLGKVPVLIVR